MWESAVDGKYKNNLSNMYFYLMKWQKTRQKKVEKNSKEKMLRILRMLLFSLV